MGAAFSSPTKDPSSPPQEASNDLIITGLGTEWPSKLIGPDELRNYALKCYSKDAPWLVNLLLQKKFPANACPGSKLY